MRRNMVLLKKVSNRVSFTYRLRRFDMHSYFNMTAMSPDSTPATLTRLTGRVIANWRELAIIFLTATIHNISPRHRNINQHYRKRDVCSSSPGKPNINLTISKWQKNRPDNIECAQTVSNQPIYTADYLSEHGI